MAPGENCNPPRKILGKIHLNLGWCLPHSIQGMVDFYLHFTIKSSSIHVPTSSSRELQLIPENGGHLTSAPQKGQFFKKCVHFRRRRGTWQSLIFCPFYLVLVEMSLFPDRIHVTGIFPYMCHQQTVGKYTIHGWMLWVLPWKKSHQSMCAF